jgi:hypothetical protein
MMLTSRGDFIDKADWSRRADLFQLLVAVVASSPICWWFAVVVPLGSASILLLLDGLRIAAMQLALLIRFGSSFAAPTNLVLPP